MVTTNATNIINNVTVYIPECSAHVSLSDISYADAQDFQPTQGSYYAGLIVPDLLPGLILGGLALLAFFFSLAWIIVQACQLRKAHKAGKPAANGWDTDEQVVGGTAMAPPAPDGKHMPRHAMIVLVLLVLLGLGTVGCAAWGMATSIMETETQIPGFWDAVEDTRNRAAGIQSDLVALNSSLPIVSSGLTIVVDHASGVVSLLASEVGSVNFTASELEQAVQPVLDAVSSVLKALSSVTGFVQHEVLDRITSIVNTAYNATQDVQDTWRYVVIAVIFGITIVIAAVLLGFLIRMGWPKTAAGFMALFWLDVAILMLVGVALLKGIIELSEDACMYSETYVENRINSSLAHSQAAVFNRAWYYYIQNGSIDEPYVNYLVGAPVDEILQFLQEPTVNETLETLGGVSVSSFTTQLGLSQEEASEVDLALQQAPVVVSNMTSLIAQLARSNLQPIYISLKSLVCCDLTNNANDIFVPWTVTSAVGFAFALLATARVVSHTVVLARRQQREALAAQGAFITTAAPQYRPDEQGYRPSDAPDPPLYQAGAPTPFRSADAQQPYQPSDDPSIGVGYPSTTAEGATQPSAPSWQGWQGGEQAPLMTAPPRVNGGYDGRYNS